MSMKARSTEPERYMSHSEATDIRQALGLTQEQMGRVLGGVSRSAVARWETGFAKVPPPAVVLYTEMRGGWKPRTLIAIELECDSQ